MKFFNKKGQNAAEYAILIVLVIAAAIAMQTYVKRGVQGRVHDASDKFGTDLSTDANWKDISSTTATLKNQYEPGEFSSKSTSETITDYEHSIMEKGGKVSRETVQATKQAAEDYQKYDYK